MLKFIRVISIYYFILSESSYLVRKVISVLKKSYKLIKKCNSIDYVDYLKVCFVNDMRVNKS